MKNLVILLFFFILLASTIFPQPWQLQITNIPSTATAFPFSPVNDNVCWASWATGWNSAEAINGYLRTTDGGTTWTGDTIAATENGMIWWIEALDANTAYIAVETWSAAGMQGIYKTTDGGATWQKHPAAYSSSGYGPGYIHFFDNNNGVAVGEVDPSTSCLEIYTTTNGGIDWNLVPSSNIPPSITTEFMQPVEVAEVGDIIWVPTVSSNGPRFYKSTNKGYNWTLLDLPSTNQDYVMFPAFQDANTGLRVVWTYTPSYAIIEKTTDGGTTWNTIPGPYAGCIPLNVSYVPGTSSAYVITGCMNVNGYANGSAYTLDGGTTWTTLDNGNYCYTIFESASVGWGTDWTTNNFYKYVGPPLPLPVELTSFTATANHKEAVLKWSTATELNNNGFEVQRKIGEQEFATIGFVKGEGTTTSKKEYSYTDKNLDDGKYSYRLKQIDFSGKYNYSDVIEVDIRGVDEYALEQNYPNPFNPTTMIGFGVREKSNVRITILNSIGEELAVVLNEEKEPGYHQIEFNAAHLPSGVYFYRIQAGNFVQTKKMILMK
jgi:photosystem II stability/assembly factor-like uncharacterized protein